MTTSEAKQSSSAGRVLDPCRTIFNGAGDMDGSDASTNSGVWVCTIHFSMILYRLYLNLLLSPTCTSEWFNEFEGFFNQSKCPRTNQKNNSGPWKPKLHSSPKRLDPNSAGRGSGVFPWFCPGPVWAHVHPTSGSPALTWCHCARAGSLLQK